jgi:hypothetical protein
VKIREGCTEWRSGVGREKASLGYAGVKASDPAEITHGDQTGSSFLAYWHLPETRWARLNVLEFIFGAPNSSHIQWVKI